MLGQSISMLLPHVIGYKIYGKLNQYATSTDLVLTVTKVRTSQMSNISLFAISLVKINLFILSASTSSWCRWEIRRIFRTRCV